MRMNTCIRAFVCRHRPTTLSHSRVYKLGMYVCVIETHTYRVSDTYRAACTRHLLQLERVPFQRVILLHEQAQLQDCQISDSSHHGEGLPCHFIPGNCLAEILHEHIQRTVDLSAIFILRVRRSRFHFTNKNRKAHKRGISH
jgi:hypothetical protein